jgi:DNA-binding Lrp family transcriptional regulator
MRTLSEWIQPQPAVELDAIDRCLLSELSKDARIPQRKLAALLGMSAPAVADRINRLKARGVIRGFRADIDWDRLGVSTVAYLSISAAPGQEQHSVIVGLLKVRGVEEITVVTGAQDLIVKVRAYSFDDLRVLLANEIWTISGVQKTETSIAMIRVEPPEAAQRLLEGLPGVKD